MSNNYKNPTKVITGPKTRWSYANVWDPKSINGGTPKYSDTRNEQEGENYHHLYLAGLKDGIRILKYLGVL